MVPYDNIFITFLSGTVFFMSHIVINNVVRISNFRLRDQQKTFVFEMPDGPLTITVISVL